MTTAPDYVPSGKHSSLLQMSLICAPVGAAVGVVAGILISLVSQLEVDLSKGLPEGISAQVLLLMGCMAWLIAFIPYCMGMLCARTAAIDCRNPRVGYLFGFATAAVALVVMVRVVMVVRGLTFAQWINLQWASNLGPSGEWSWQALWHLVPMTVLFVVSGYAAATRARHPFCESCRRWCKRVPAGELSKPLEAHCKTAATLDLKREEGKSIREFRAQYSANLNSLRVEIHEKQASLVADIVKERKHDSKDEWTRVYLTLCESCKKKGYLSFCSCCFERGKVQEKERGGLIALSEANLRDLLAASQYSPCDSTSRIETVESPGKDNGGVPERGGTSKS